MSRGRKIWLAFLAALLGLAVGAIAAGLIGTVKLMLMPGLEYASLRDFLVGLPLIFLEGLLWSVVGGAMFVLPPGFLLLAATAGGRPGSVVYPRLGCPVVPSGVLLWPCRCDAPGGTDAGRGVDLNRRLSRAVDEAAVDTAAVGR